MTPKRRRLIVKNEHKGLIDGVMRSPIQIQDNSSYTLQPHAYIHPMAIK